ncbi:MAG: septum formation protein Maf [Bacteroidales bacterium]|jgi:septum formation protein|nr:Maf family nucleotide pyrophosphatase [Bacteroidales bacterium]MCK9498276.1 Maf family nucleotide pyrophosphatase [Bacteroidales bacterium]MDY0314906.1 Maf family nucleotide pyrophosphatase [Bacteroidales bacterium]NLB86156.1 septum formation protein Maf [Bacteroidales bacterium]
MEKYKFLKPNYKILLASSSPRRQELISNFNFNLEIVKSPDAKEIIPDNVFRENIAIYLAKEKSIAYKDLKENEILVTADTIVWKDNRVLGKPINKKDAVEMLEFLSDKEHFVFTGVCLRSTNKTTSFFAETKVKFSKLSKEEILYYIENYKPYDKAGAYGIQEWIGMIAVEYIEGSFYNVMGLPAQKLYKEILRF